MSRCGANPVALAGYPEGSHVSADVHGLSAEGLKQEKDTRFMHRMREKPKRRHYAVLDIESKKKDTQEAGFERAFLACFYDGDDYETWRSDEELRIKSYTECSWLDPGGCIDRMMRHILGMRICTECEIGERDYKFGSCPDCIEARLKYQKNKWYIGAHNGGNFDNLFILGWLRLHADKFGFDIISTMGRIIMLTVKPRGRLAGRKKSEGWSFVDTFAVLPISLREIGETFCANEPAFQKMSFDLDIPEESFLWEEYNRQDCIVLHKALHKFRTLMEKLGGAVGMTAAGTAVNLFRLKFQQRPIWRNLHFPECEGVCTKQDCPIQFCQRKREHKEHSECHGCMHDFIRDAFFGGRTEVFRLFGKDVYYYDINSSYPTAMLGDMPTGQATVLPEGTSLKMLEAMAKTKIGFLECVISVPVLEELDENDPDYEKKRISAYLPILPYRWINPDTKDQKLIFPTGTLYGTWSWIEISEALGAGAKLLAIGRSVWYGKSKIFDKMIHTLYAFRNKKCLVCNKDVSKGKCKCPVKTWDKGLDYCAKLMMNSTFGRFGTNPIREQIIFPMEEDEIPDFAVFPPAHLAERGAPLRLQKILEADYIIPQIAAYITAEARVRVHRGLKSVLDRGGWIIYTDTDACMGTLPVSPEGSKLGQWKLENKHFDVEVPLPKTYMMRLHEGGCEGTDPDCKGCARKHKEYCDDWSCEGCLDPIYVKMKGVPKGVQRPEVFDHLVRGTGPAYIDAKTKKLVKKIVDDEEEMMGSGSVYFDRLTKFLAMFKPTQDSQFGLFSPVEKEASRSIRSTYDKRRLRHACRLGSYDVPLGPGHEHYGDTVPHVIRDPMTLSAARRARKAAMGGLSAIGSSLAAA